MTVRKNIKTKESKLAKKKSTPRSTKTLRPLARAKSKESAVLLSTEISGASITHGHSAYQHPTIEHKPKKLDDKSQRLIMYVGISLIMTVIVVFWILNLKHTLGPDAFSITAPASEDPKTKTDFESLKNNLSKSLSEVQSEIKNLEDLSKTKSTEPVITSTTTPAIITSEASPALPNTLPK